MGVLTRLTAQAIAKTGIADSRACFWQIHREALWDLLSLGVVLVSLVLVLSTFRDYGVSWDETLQNTYGEKLVAMYRSGFQDRSALTYVNLYLYGGLFDMVAARAPNPAQRLRIRRRRSSTRQK